MRWFEVKIVALVSFMADLYNVHTTSALYLTMGEGDANTRMLPRRYLAIIGRVYVEILMRERTVSARGKKISNTCVAYISCILWTVYPSSPMLAWLVEWPFVKSNL